MSHSPLADSSGVPWAGREFSKNDWAADDGTAPGALSKAMKSEPLDKAAVFEALRSARLLVPLVATVGETGLGEHGLKVDKSADLAIVAVATPDGKTAIPAFSSVQAMSTWSNEARPVPIEAIRVALAAIGEGHERVILDAGGAAVALRRPALAALAQGFSWSPPHQSSPVQALIDGAVKTQQAISSVELFDGDPHANLSGPELLIQLGLAPGLRADELRELLEAFHQQLMTQEFLQLVDSISVRLVSA